MVVFSRFSLLISIILFLSACEINIQSDPFKAVEDKNLLPCEFVENLDIPLPYSLIQIGEISSDNNISAFQMVTQNTGYGMGSTVKGGYPFVVKTLDAGKTWTEISPETAHYPISLFFQDELTGFITVHDITGCPNACQNKTVLLKTTDGGQTWEEVQYPNLSGILYHLQSDSQGNLFANLFTTKKVVLVKSIDQGATFEKIYESENYGFSDVRFSLTIQDDLLYASGKEDMLFVLNTEGDLIDIFRTGGSSSIIGLSILSSELFLLSTSNELILSKDAGKTWSIIREGKPIVIDTNLSKGEEVEALILTTTGYCPTDVVRAIDIFAYTNDSGLSWIEGEATENTSLHLSTPSPTTMEFSGLFIHQKKLYQVSQ